MNIEHDPRLTSAEISYLWEAYLNESMSVCVYKYLLFHIKDTNIKSLAEKVLAGSQEYVNSIHGILTSEEIQVPQGFTDEDVNLKAKRLFSDNFCLYYIRNMISLGLSGDAISLTTIYRQDILSLNSNNLINLIKLNSETSQIILEKGLTIRPPYIPYPTEIEFIHKQSFILELLGTRPLTSQEVTTLYVNILSNNIGLCISFGFAQITDSKEVRDYFLRGKEIGTKHLKVFSDYLEKHSLPVTMPMAINQDVTDSSESPFSDKLLMFHYLMMMGSGASNYGNAIATSMRSDLVVDFSRLMTETMKFNEDGMNIMIKNSWFERPPLASYREKD
ncbi:DUF3231 family protein [Paenisporosarcina sp. TG20]|uniref:DUF3231 family protein n=1 Tax=Paenisporosarcina sp. TG20 TaxID=1211706 RepID=UPI000320099F|nr:DUF3231 family protein [Paenisporosarcina sp. TG20]